MFSHLAHSLSHRGTSLYSCVQPFEAVPSSSPRSQFQYVPSSRRPVPLALYRVAIAELRPAAMVCTPKIIAASSSSRQLGRFPPRLLPFFCAASGRLPLSSPPSRRYVCRSSLNLVFSICWPFLKRFNFFKFSARFQTASLLVVFAAREMTRPWRPTQSPLSLLTVE